MVFYNSFGNIQASILSFHYAFDNALEERCMGTVAFIILTTLTTIFDPETIIWIKSYGWGQVATEGRFWGAHLLGTFLTHDPFIWPHLAGNSNDWTSKDAHWKSTWLRSYEWHSVKQCKWTL